MARKGAGLALLLCGLLVSACSLPGGGLLTRSPTLITDRPSDLLPPEGFRVVATEDRQIALAWDPVLVGHVAGYTVLRSTQASGPYELAGQTRSRFGTVYTDSGKGSQRLGDGKAYHYRVHPYDDEGRVSRSHAYLQATTDPPPQVPSGLRAYSNLPRLVVLEWEPSSDRSVAGYAILRSPTLAGPWERVGYVKGRYQTVYEDPIPGDLRVMYYGILAANAFGGESEMTEPIRAVTKADPLPPIGLKVARRRLGSLTLHWAPNVEQDLHVYEMWRAEPAEAEGTRERRIAEISVPHTQFTDPTVGCGQKLRYRLRVIDADGLVSAFSKPTLGVGKDLGLKARVEPGGVELRWDKKRTRGWPNVRILERRRARPDREVLKISNETQVSLELEPGPHELAVSLSRAAADSPDGAGDTETITCSIHVLVP